MRHAMQEAFDKKRRECVTILKSTCSDSIRPYVSRVGGPIEIWATWNANLVDGEPFEDYFAKLIDIRNQLHGTPDAITDAQFKAQIMRSMPPWMSVTVQFVYQKPEITPGEVMYHICNMAASLRAVEKPAAEAEALATESRKSTNGRKWCNNCKDKSLNFSDIADWYR
ncbi:Protein of unknown function [Pyronema omphalodes CBS 100304]|uniref:Uncharacterized protein n=1 Tax=Pyronema omphalodes (strain CBS 100304) TaxID=1076935 RepID=U4KYH5_PYROM|nr:Protein of unknown function [Pyronema omphalodes CBS 100304]